MPRLSFLLMTMAAGGLAAEDSVVPPMQVVERLKRQTGDKLLRFRPGQIGPRLHLLTAPLTGACSVRMPRADASGGGATADAKMVLPLDPQAVREQYPMPQARVPAPECPGK